MYCCRIGASKGIGKSIALQFNQRFKENTIFVLLARDLNKLNEVKSQLESESISNKVLLTTIDFSNATHQYNDYKDILQSLLESTDLNLIDELYAIYNHGTFKILTIDENAKTIDENFQTNVTSVWKLLTAIRQLFENVEKQWHINLSSMLATTCVPLSSSYSSSK
jgi:short-subunit dehydrogenase